MAMMIVAVNVVSEIGFGDSPINVHRRFAVHPINIRNERLSPIE
jgi:hypothetical protein